MSVWAVINLGIGHWPPSEMERMTLTELEQWYEIAIDILNAKAKANGS
jgi:hypothetical protein